MIKAIFKDEKLRLAFQKMIEQLKLPDSQDRGPAFIAFGKMALIVDREVFIPYLGQILNYVKAEIKHPPAQKNGIIAPIANLDSLTCLKQLLKKYAEFMLEKGMINMFEIINNIFYSGYNR